VVRAPVPNSAFDVSPGLELTIERTLCQLRHFIIRRESEADELLGRQISNAAAHIAGENALEADAFLQTNDAILSAEGHGP
jgi:hypothetical protein